MSNADFNCMIFSEANSASTAWCAKVRVSCEDDSVTLDFISASRHEPPCLSAYVDEDGFVNVDLVDKNGELQKSFTVTGDGTWNEKELG